MFLQSTTVAILLAAIPATLAMPANPVVTPTGTATPQQSCPPLPSNSPQPVKTFDPTATANPCAFPDGYKACTTDQLTTLTCTGGQWKPEVCGLSSAGWKESCHTFINALLPNADCHTGWTPWYTMCTGYEDMVVPEPNISNTSTNAGPGPHPSVPARL